MENESDRHRRARNDERYNNASSNKSQPAPPGYQYRSTAHMNSLPATYRSNTRPTNAQFPAPGRNQSQLRAIRDNDGYARNAVNGPQIPRSVQIHNNSQSSPPAHRVRSRQLSHISALTHGQTNDDAVSISDIDSSYVMSPISGHGEGSYHSAVSSASNSRRTSIGDSNRNGRFPVVHRKDGKPETHRPQKSDHSAIGDQTATMQALTQAIRSGLHHSKPPPISTNPSTETKVRMPFQEPASPTSIYTETTTHNHNSIPISSYQGYDPRQSKPSTISERDANDYEKSDYNQDLATPMSHMSSFPIVSADESTLSSRIPAERRPPKLDIGAIREAEARGSMTSLSDLIKRATRLASNLDRGKTASRFGELNMFGSAEKLGGSKARGSTYSDVLAAFPQPDGTPTGNRPTTMWPTGEKTGASKTSLGNTMTATGKPKRRCCGMSPLVFVLVLVIVIALIAAAVLVPVFLIVLPNQDHSGSKHGTCTLTCQNGGVKVGCSCVCVDGFTGNDCSTGEDPDCITATLSQSPNTYNNATVGSSVLPLLQNQQRSFSIPLNVTAILSTFATNNLSCVSENSLVNFSAAQKAKRYVLTPEMLLGDTHRVQPSPTVTLQPRQDATQSANGIVFATSAGASNVNNVAATASASASSSTSTNTNNLNVTDTQLDFGATVVLYVLQSYADISVTVAAKQAISSYFQTTHPSNTVVNLIGGSQKLSADFAKFEITFANGTSIGGRTS